MYIHTLSLRDTGREVGGRPGQQNCLVTAVVPVASSSQMLLDVHWGLFVLVYMYIIFLNTVVKIITYAIMNTRYDPKHSS